MSNFKLNNVQQYFEDKINLRQLCKLLNEQSRFIFRFTIASSLIVIVYILVFRGHNEEY